MRNTLWAFENYLLANKNTEKPILHISLNPSVDDKLTDSQFADLAREYMQRMGYGDQPYIVYIHEDISLPGTGTQVRTEAGGGQTQGNVGTISEKSRLSEWRCKATSFQHPQERILHLPLSVIRGVQRVAVLLQHRGEAGQGRI